MPLDISLNGVAGIGYAQLVSSIRTWGLNTGRGGNKIVTLRDTSRQNDFIDFHFKFNQGDYEFFQYQITINAVQKDMKVLRNYNHTTYEIVSLKTAFDELCKHPDDYPPQGGLGENLGTVVVYIAEAARSKLVFGCCSAAYPFGRVRGTKTFFIVNDYKKTQTNCHKRVGDPLRYADYKAYYESGGFTGDSEKLLSDLAALQQYD